MKNDCLKNSLDINNLIDTVKWRANERREHPYYMRTFGTCIFCGAQGEGKTLSAVQYVLKLCQCYPRAVLVSNVAIKDRPFNAVLVPKVDEKGRGVKNEIDEQVYVFKRISDGKLFETQDILEYAEEDDYEPLTVEYTGLDCLKYANNGEYGVIFLIDEIHLELNSLESKNIDIETIVEISQQRKQKKHIVGTSQVFMRMAKPLREQIHDIVLCKCYFNVLQFNKWIRGDTAEEKNGKLEAEVKGRYIWWHSPDYYEQYDTYAKMKRYNKEWKGRKRVDNLYEREVFGGVEFKR